MKHMRQQAREMDSHMLQYPEDYYDFDTSGRVRASDTVFATHMQELRKDLEERIADITEEERIVDSAEEERIADAK
jgi:hypothetical protein